MFWKQEMPESDDFGKTKIFGGDLTLFTGFNRYPYKNVNKKIAIQNKNLQFISGQGPSPLFRTFPLSMYIFLRVPLEISREKKWFREVNLLFYLVNFLSVLWMMVTLV